MKYFVVAPFSFESVTGYVTIPAGKVLELSIDQAARLTGKIEVIAPPNGGRDLSHYCTPAACWCSQKLPAANYPAGCSKCEYFHTTGDHQ